MLDNLVISDNCLLALAKLENFLDHDSLEDFLKRSYNTSKYTTEILIIHTKNRLYVDVESSSFNFLKIVEKSECSCIS